MSIVRLRTGRLLPLLALAAALNCEAATTNAVPGKPQDAVARASISPWKPLFQGIAMCEGSARTPRPIQVRALRVDLRAAGIELLVTPSNGDEPKDVGARKTTEFLSEFKCQAAINGSVFDVFSKAKGDPMDVEGLSLSKGDEYSPANKYDALLISRNNKAWIARSPVDTRGAYNGLSGFYALFLKGTNNGTMRELQPRSAAGVSRNGRYLYFVVIDGRMPGYSEGTTTAETAEWMRKLGAYDALNFDGGGSATLVIEDAVGKPRILNREGSNVERRVANHLGVYARPLRTR